MQDYGKLKMLLREAGMPLNLAGTRYLVQCVEWYAPGRRFVDVYDYVAKQESKHWRSISRGIIYAISKSKFAGKTPAVVIATLYDQITQEDERR